MPLIPHLLIWQALSALRALDTAVAADADGDMLPILPSEVRFVEASWKETVLRGRPWVPQRRLGTLSKGTRLAVRGVVESRDPKGCGGAPWYAVHPFGYVCSKHVKETSSAPDPGIALPLRAGKRLPFNYAYARQDGVPVYATLDDVLASVPARTLTKGMSLVVRSSTKLDGRTFLVTDVGLIAKEDARWGGQGSAWSGVFIDGQHRGPSFAWVHKHHAPVYAAHDGSAKRVNALARRERVPLLESWRDMEGGPRWYRIADAQWIRATHLNEVVLIEPPRGALGEPEDKDARWIDVDLGEQVLVAYRGSQPHFATLVSSGRSHPTPRGNYPIWAKVASMTMANQAYEDKPYMVQGVPWVLLFQGHNALHGAYWHDRFGTRKSHGCVNLSPLDARWIFEWAGPALPEGWTGYLPGDEHRSVVVHVRDSSRPEGEQFTQERAVGPPDREAEKRKVEEALARRARAEPPEPAEPPLDLPPTEAPHIEATPAPSLLRDAPSFAQ